MPATRLRMPPSSGNAYMRDILETSLLAAAVGALTGLVAVGVRLAIALVTGFFFRNEITFEFETPADNALGLWVVLVPAVGAGLAYVIVRLLSADTRVRGSAEVIRVIFQRRGRISPRRVAGHALATIVHVGAGGSAGREGAMVQLGAALGMIASGLRGTSIRHRKILLAAGAAAAVGSTFNTPIAGVLFAAEVILLEWSTRSFIPLTVASAMGDLVALQFLGDQPAFPIPPYELVAARELFLYILLGVLCGLLAIAVLRALSLADHVFSKVPGPPWVTPILGGLLVGVIGYFVPEVFGVGYEVVRAVLMGDFVAASLFLVLVAKLVAFAITRGSGGASGAFSPSLFLGAALGGVFGAVVNALFPEWTGNAGAYALVGMAAVYASVTRASLTAVVLLYEMTHTFSIIIPVMLAVVVADALTKAYGGGTFYRMAGRGGERVPVETDAAVNVLDLVPVADIMSAPVDTVRADAPVREVVEARFRTGHQGYPVVDEKGALVGIITSTDMRRKVKETDLDRPVRDFMTPDPSTVTAGTTAHQALSAMVQLDVGHLPVVDEKDETRLLGILTRTDLIGVERRVMAEEEAAQSYLTTLRPYFRLPGKERP